MRIIAKITLFIKRNKKAVGILGILLVAAAIILPFALKSKKSSEDSQGNTGGKIVNVNDNGVDTKSDFVNTSTDTTKSTEKTTVISDSLENNIQDGKLVSVVGEWFTENSDAFAFNKDDTFTIILSDGNSYNGTYTYENEKITLNSNANINGLSFQFVSLETVEEVDIEFNKVQTTLIVIRDSNGREYRLRKIAETEIAEEYIGREVEIDTFTVSPEDESLINEQMGTETQETETIDPSAETVTFSEFETENPYEDIDTPLSDLEVQRDTDLEVPQP